MKSIPLELESLSPLRVTLGRLLSSRKASFQASWHDRPLELAINPEQPENLPPWQLSLEINGQPLEVFISNKFLDHLLPDQMNHKAAGRLPEDLLLAALEHSLTPLLQMFSQSIGLSIVFTEFEPTDVSMIQSTLALDVSVDGVKTQIQLELNDLVLGIINAFPAHLTARMPDIPFWASLELGRTRLPLSDLERLENGDVVFLDQHVSGQQLILRVNRQLAFLGEASGTQVTIKQRLQAMDEQAEQQTPQDNSQESSSVDLNDLPVDLMFEVGQQQMSAAELQGIQPGYIFELDRPIEQPVKIRANGKFIGECQLVQIENRLGALVTRLVDSNE